MAYSFSHFPRLWVCCLIVVSHCFVFVFVDMKSNFCFTSYQFLSFALHVSAAMCHQRYVICKVYSIVIYTTIGAASSYFRLRDWTKISPSAPNSTAITAYIFLCIDLANPLHLDSSLFAFIICFYDQKSSKKQQRCENALNGVIY